MGLHWFVVVCPECEGDGREVDTFNPPLAGFSLTDCGPKSLALVLTPHRSRDGRAYKDGCPCPACDGSKWISGVMSPSGMWADWWPGK